MVGSFSWEDTFRCSLKVTINGKYLIDEEKVASRIF